jgi:outer membrane biosynthesis protein TonB
VPCGAAVLCAEDLHAFCLEVSSGNYARTSQGQPELARGGRAATATADAAAASISQGEMGAEQAEQRVRLGLAVRRLLAPLMAVPQAGAPSVATRLLASLRVRVLLHTCPQNEARSAAEHAALESACVLALLSWYRPAAPAETTRLAAFCAHAVPLLLHANDAPQPQPQQSQQQPQQQPQLSPPSSPPLSPDPCAPAALREVMEPLPYPNSDPDLDPDPSPSPNPNPDPNPNPNPDPQPQVMELLSVACTGCAEDPASCEGLVRLAHGWALPTAHLAWRRTSAAGDAHSAAALLSSLVALQSRLLRAPLPDPAMRRALGGGGGRDEP